MSKRHGPAVWASIATVLIALTGCTSSGKDSSAQVATTFEKGVLTSEQNLGSATDQRAVRRAVVAALSDENRAFVVGQELRGTKPADVLAVITAAGPTRARAALLGRARTPTLATGSMHSFRLYAEEEFGAAWTGSGSQDAWLDHDVWASSSFHVERWQGVRVDARTARALVRGEDLGTSWGGAPKRDNWAQYKLILRRDPTAPDGWRVIDERASTTAP